MTTTERHLQRPTRYNASANNYHSYMNVGDWTLINPDIGLWVRMVNSGSLAACWVMPYDKLWMWGTAKNSSQNIEKTKELAMFLADLELSSSDAK